MIHLVDIDESNWRIRLSVREDQKHFVANAAVLLARAYAYRNFNCRAFYVCDDDNYVGMGLYYDCPERNAYDMSQLFIDERYQGRGYGKAAMALCLREMRSAGRFDKVELCYVEGAETAKHLYEKLGFVEVDRDGDEIIMAMKL
ncbi:MAG: GNAT family N-acetyltransferase [Clostridia bacterium]|nr:GNAT family N-acetyltransferase [Clostridia bacterium]